jgi:hypothetical protein
LCIPNLLAAWCGKTCNIDRYKVERRTFQSTIIPSPDGPDKVWTIAIIKPLAERTRGIDET